LYSLSTRSGCYTWQISMANHARPAIPSRSSLSPFPLYILRSGVYDCAQHRRIIYIIIIIIILSIQCICLMPAISESVEYVRARSVEINDRPPLTFDLSNWIQRAPPIFRRPPRDTRHSFYCSRHFSVKSIPRV